MERFFDLATPQVGDQPAGWVGQITSNSFMKREFGSKIIEEFLVRQDLRLVVDTSGAYIPGHGTPTVIIAGQHRRPVTDALRGVLGIRGEPGQPDDPRHGLVWTSITCHVDEPWFEDAWVSVVDLPREALAKHPWSLSGGGAGELMRSLESSGYRLVGYISPPIGGSIRAGADEAFMRPFHYFSRKPRLRERMRELVTGDVVRDWSMGVDVGILFPYAYGSGRREAGELPRELWPWRALLAARSTFQGNMADAGLDWWEYMQFTNAPYLTPLSITFAEVATHNHFVLDRGGRVFKQTAPVIKLSESASEQEHLGLLGVLNSSTACFWLKQNCYPKGGDPVGDSGARVSQQPWSDRYQFNGANVQDIPIPSKLSLDRARHLDQLAQQLSAQSPAQVVQHVVPTADLFQQTHCAYNRIRGQMIAEQEELDWEVYGLYGLPGGDLIYHGDDLPELRLGERAFEIALARKVAGGEEETAWFTRHGSTPITEIPSHWPAAIPRASAAPARR